MKVEKNSGMFPAWLDNFISNYGNSKKKVAETNVESLPTVNWKNETYYVQDKGNGVTLYTKYGNIVRFIPDSELNSELVAQNERVKAVNQLLQEDNVVASLDDEIEKADNDVDVDLDLACGGCDTEVCDDVVADEEFENELEKVADLEDGLPQETEETEPTTETEETQTSTEEATTASVSEGIEDMAGVPSEGIEDMVGEVSEGIEDVVEDTVAVEPETCPECGAECSDGECACDCDCNDECDCAEETVKIPTEEFVTKASYNRLLAKVKQLEKTIKAFSEAQHAYTAPENNAYDLNSQDAEVNHFQEAAETTQKVIDKEHELDLSKMSDRAKLNENFLEDLLSVDAENFNEVMEEIKEPATTEEVPAEQVEETPVEETVEVEEEAPAEEVGEELPVETPVEETPTDDIVVVEEDELPVVEEMPGVPQIYMLDDPKQIEEFTVQTCPMCHAEKSLNGVERIAGVVGVVCNHCGQEFAVTDDAIYINKNK